MSDFQKEIWITRCPHIGVKVHLTETAAIEEKQKCCEVLKFVEQSVLDLCRDRHHSLAELHTKLLAPTNTQGNK